MLRHYYCYIICCWYSVATDLQKLTALHFGAACSTAFIYYRLDPFFPTFSKVLQISFEIIQYNFEALLQNPSPN